MFDKIKRFYDFGLYNKEMVKNFVKKGALGADAYEEITGEPYEVVANGETVTNA